MFELSLSLSCFIPMLSIKPQDLSVLITLESYHKIITGALLTNYMVEFQNYLYRLFYTIFCSKYNSKRNKFNFASDVLQLASSTSPFVHQGTYNWLRLRSYEKFLPAWVSIVIIIICLMFSALFSGLNLGLMSLDRTDLKVRIFFFI